MKLNMRLLAEYFQQYRRFQRNARLYLINSVLSGVTGGILLVLYNLYLVSLGYKADFVGLVLFMGTLGAGLAIFPAGICIDRFSSKAILIWSNALIGVAGAGQILFRQPVPLLVSAFLAGIGLAFILVINAPFLTRNSTPEERAHLFSLNISLGLITLVLGEVIGGALPGWFRSLSWLMAPLPGWANGALASQPGPRSYQLALLFAGLIAAPSFIPLLMLSGGRPERREVGDERGTRAAQAPTPHTTTAPAPTERTAQMVVPAMDMEKPLHVPTMERVGKLVRSPFFVFALVYGLTGAGAGFFIPYFNIYFVQHLGASPFLFGLIDGGANAITALTTVLAPLLAARVGRTTTIVLTRIVSIPLLLTIGLTGILPLAALLYLFRQGTMDMAAVVLQVYSMEVVPEKYRGVANSGYQAAFQVPNALTTPLGGLLIVSVGYPAIFLIGACCYVLTIVLLWVKLGRKL